MQVQVTDRSGNVITYGYAPEHASGVFEYYNGLRSCGVIRSFTIIR